MRGAVVRTIRIEDGSLARAAAVGGEQPEGRVRNVEDDRRRKNAIDLHLDCGGCTWLHDVGNEGVDLVRCREEDRYVPAVIEEDAGVPGDIPIGIVFGDIEPSGSRPQV